jgi:hypothetical protein
MLLGVLSNTPGHAHTTHRQGQELVQVLVEHVVIVPNEGFDVVKAWCCMRMCV